MVWRTDNWKELHHFQTDDGGEAYTHGIAWSPTGDRLAFCTGELVTVWSVNGGRRTLQIRAHSRETNSISWSPDGSRFATGGDDHLIKLWDANTGDDMLTLQGHTSIVPYLAWSPDGRKLASSDGTNVLLWDATRGYSSF
jgi:WD40 repeat protein